MNKLDNVNNVCKISKVCAASSVLDSAVQYVKDADIASVSSEIADSFYEFILAHEKLQNVLLNEQTKIVKTFM